ncbi:MAG: hypothetical protein ACR2FH_01335, partial [Caulobacteraceae bacterium]
MNGSPGKGPGDDGGAGEQTGSKRAARLDGEIFLGVGDLGFSRVAVLGDQVTGEAGEVEIVYFALSARADLDHLADDERAGEQASPPRYRKASLVSPPPLPAQHPLHRRPHGGTVCLVLQAPGEVGAQEADRVAAVVG